MTDERKDITAIVDLWPRGDQRIFFVIFVFVFANSLPNGQIGTLPLSFVFLVATVPIIFLLPALFRKLVLPSLVTYNSLGIYVTRKGNERFYPWNCIQAGIQWYDLRYDRWGRRLVCATVRTVGEEFYFNYGFGSASKKKDIEHVSGFLKVLEKSIPSQSVYLINEPDSIKEDLITTVIAAMAAGLLCYWLPVQDPTAELPIFATVLGISFWISSVVPKIKTIHRPRRISSGLAAWFLATGIFHLIASAG